MATRVSNTVLNYSSTTNFRAWGSDINAGMTAMGWAKTADTGQIDWATVNAPGTTNTIMGYEMWASQDSLSSTFPIYIKLEYGSSAVANAVALPVTIGTKTDGSGNIYGGIFSRIFYTNPTNTTNTGENDYCWETTGGSFVFALARNQTGSGQARVVMVERSRNASGVPTDEYVTCMFSQYTTFAYQVLFNGGGQGPKDSTYISYILPTSSSSSLAGGTFQTSPHWPLIGRIPNPGMMLMCGMNAEVGGNGTQFSVPHYGATHNYLSLGTIANTFTSPIRNSTNQCFGILWE